MGSPLDSQMPLRHTGSPPRKPSFALDKRTPRGPASHLSKARSGLLEGDTIETMLGDITMSATEAPLSRHASQDLSDKCATPQDVYSPSVASDEDTHALDTVGQLPRSCYRVRFLFINSLSQIFSRNKQYRQRRVMSTRPPSILQPPPLVRSKT